MRHSNWNSIRSATSGRKRKRTIRRATIILVNCVANPLLRRGVPVRVVPLVSGQMAIDIGRREFIFVLEHRTVNGHEGGRLARSS